MRLHFARKQKNSYRLSLQTMKVFTWAHRNEVEFRAIFISVNLTEMNVHFGCVNADDLNEPETEVGQLYKKLLVEQNKQFL